MKKTLYALCIIATTVILANTCHPYLTDTQKITTYFSSNIFLCYKDPNIRDL